MKTIDKLIFALIGLGAVLLFAYGFAANTGYTIVMTGAAIQVASLGYYFWGLLLVIFIAVIVLLRIRRK